MKIRGRFLWAAALILCLSAPVNLYAEDAVLTGSQKTHLAGELIKSVMDLLLEHYIGDEITPEYLYESALRGMMDSLDPYSQYLTADELAKLQKSFSGKMFGLGITLNGSSENFPVINSVLKDSPAERAGLLKGDVLIEINKIDIKGFSLDKILSIIEEKNIVTIKIQRGSETFEKSIEKQEINVPTVTSAQFEDLIDIAEKRDNSALRYIVISEFGSETDNEFGVTINKLLDQGVKRVVIDLRGNPGGYADSVIKVCNRIVPKGPIMFTIDKQSNKIEVKSRLEESPFEKMVVLTDSATASAAEVLASALQDSKAAIIVGETTYGKGVIQSLYPMPVGGALKFTTEEYLRRSGAKIDKIGVTPDVIEAMPDLITDPVILDDNNASDTLPSVREALSYLKYDLKAVNNEKIYDSYLKETVKRFQKDAGIDANGDLDTNTLIQLNLAIYTVYTENDRPLKKAYEILREGL